MRPSALLLLAAASSLPGLASPLPQPVPPPKGVANSGPVAPLVTEGLIWVVDPKPEPATSDRARIASGPSERKEAATPEIRQAPVGGQTGGKSAGTEREKHYD
jgi:hypothetical protein